MKSLICLVLGAFMVSVDPSIRPLTANSAGSIAQTQRTDRSTGPLRDGRARYTAERWQLTAGASTGELQLELVDRKAVAVDGERRTILEYSAKWNHLSGRLTREHGTTQVDVELVLSGAGESLRCEGILLSRCAGRASRGSTASDSDVMVGAVSGREAGGLWQATRTSPGRPTSDTRDSRRSQSDRMALQRQVDSLKRQLADQDKLRRERDDANSELDTLKKRHAEELSTLEARRKKAVAVAAGRIKELSKLKKDVGKLKQERAKLLGKLASNAMKIKILESRPTIKNAPPARSVAQSLHPAYAKSYGKDDSVQFIDFPGKPKGKLATWLSAHNDALLITLSILYSDSEIAQYRAAERGKCKTVYEQMAFRQKMIQSSLHIVTNG